MSIWGPPSDSAELILPWVPVPAMVTHMSRGIDSSQARLAPGSMRTTMMVSLSSDASERPRSTGSSGSRPSALSTPTTRMLMGSLDAVTRVRVP